MSRNRVYDPPKSLNVTLALDLPFQTLAVDFLPNLKTSSITARSRNASSLSKSRISLFNVHLALFVQRMTQLWLQNHIGKYCHLVI